MRKPIEPAKESAKARPISTSAHDAHCFVVMPFGRDADEERWFSGWYETVIKPAIVSSGLEPILAAAQDQPSAINDELRAHLAFDEMVIVDLGGRAAEDPPNPNVMYELGIRHAFGLPVVVMAWEGQHLPFDVNNQRAILSRRDFLDIEPVRARLIRFIKAAQEGNFYKPMDAVGREAAIDSTSLILGEESMLAALAAEVRDLRGTINAQGRTPTSRWKRAPKIKNLLDRSLRSELWVAAQRRGIGTAVWGKYLNFPIAPEFATESEGWSFDDWLAHLETVAPTLQVPVAPQPDPAFLEQVRLALPQQPWPVGVHKEVAVRLGASDKEVSRAIKALIKGGSFLEQVNGKLIEHTILDKGTSQL